MAKKGGPKGEDWVKCPWCESRNYYHKVQTQRYRCRKCGTEFVRDDKRKTTRRVPS